MATQLFDKSQAFFAELVPMARTPLVRDQPGQTLGLESKLSLVKRRARKPKCRGRPGDGLAIGLNTPQHLVFDLESIARIEEVVLDEKGVEDLLGVRIERTLPLQSLRLGVG